MFDTSVTIVGNVLNQPETRQTLRTGAMVTSFRVASTARRFDRAREAWVDGESLRVKVSCWRKLGDHVAASVRQGDPVIVSGRIYSREYLTKSGEKRIALEIDAAAVGHDLARGTGRFNRWRPASREGVGASSESLFGDCDFSETSQARSGLPIPDIDFSDVLGVNAEFSEVDEGSEDSEIIESTDSDRILATSSIGT